MVRVSKPELHRTISEIMRKGNLDHLTTKKIRLLCEEKYNTDLSTRRDEIDRIVMAFVKKKSGVESDENSNEESSDEEGGEEEVEEEEGSEEEGSSCSSESGSESCTGSECSYSGSSEEEAASKTDVKKVSEKPPTQKQVPVKKAASTSQKRKVAVAPKNLPPSKSNKKEAATALKQIEMDDAAYARKLQAEEWNFRQRTVKKLFPTRGPPRNNANAVQNKKKKASGFSKKCLLSPTLAEVLGSDELSRPEIVQKMWSIVKERKLFDPNNKQYAFCDEELLKVFGKKRIRLIGMMKYLKHHIKDIGKN